MSNFQSRVFMKVKPLNTLNYEVKTFSRVMSYVLSKIKPIDDFVQFRL